MDRKLSKSKNLILAVLGIIFLFLGWILASIALGETRVPSPYRILSRYIETFGSCPEIQFQGAGSNGFWPHVR